jgi:UDP-N-acetylmuramate--alanine ligase
LWPKDIEVLITLGAGDIDNYVPAIQELLEKKGNLRP